MQYNINMEYNYYFYYYHQNLYFITMYLPPLEGLSLFRVIIFYYFINKLCLLFTSDGKIIKNIFFK